MVKESIPISFVNTALGDQFDRERKFVRNRTPKEFAQRFTEALRTPTGLVAMAEIPGMGDPNPTVDKRSPFLAAVAGHLGKDYQILQFSDAEREGQMATLGLAIITRLPIKSSKLFFYLSPREIIFLTYPYGAITVTFEYLGKEVDFTVLHYDPFQKILKEREFEEDEAEAVNEQLEAFTQFFTPRIDESGDIVPRILIGDTNADENNAPAHTLVENLIGLGYREDKRAMTMSTIPGSTDRRADRLFVTSELSIEHFDLFNVDSDHFGISASIISI